MTSRIIPAKNDWIPARTMNPQTISVGKRGTSPVTRYSLRMGNMNSSAAATKIRQNAPKKRKGLYVVLAFALCYLVPKLLLALEMI